MKLKYGLFCLFFQSCLFMRQSLRKCIFLNQNILRYYNNDSNAKFNIKINITKMNQQKQSPQSKKTSKKIVLENPFHPLDLSFQDLLTIYKRFDTSSQINHNPKQQLPIQTITQLISTIKGCRPSYIQKSMSQALIKQTLSWNDFLAFLDQESEVRHKIMDWLMHEKATIKYKFTEEYPFRNKIQKYYDQITYLNFINLGADSLMFVVIDYKKIILISLTEGSFKAIDCFMQKNQAVKRDIKEFDNLINQSKISENKHDLRKSSAHRQKYKTGKNIGNRSLLRSQKNIHHSDLGLSVQGSVHLHQIDDETYFKKERKNIHSVFSLFTETPLQQSTKIAGLMSQRIKNRTVNSSYISSLKDKYGCYQSQKQAQQKDLGKQQLKPLQKAVKKLNSMYKQKNQLSYNPYQTTKTAKRTTPYFQINAPMNKKLNYERKQKQYFLQSCAQKFNKQLQCIGIIYYNMEVCLLRIVREYNKIVLSEQDRIKIPAEKDHKKNQVAEAVDFYKHRITNKWFLLVLFRMEYKNENRGRNGSIIKGFQLQINENKRKGGICYKFADKKQQFVINLGCNQMISILAQSQFGVHAISHNGKYIICKQDYIQQNQQIYYWKIEREQKFKNVNVSLSCLCTSPEYNKALIGTIKGILIIYDLFSHQYKLKKVCSDKICEIKMDRDRGYLLTSGQKIIIYDIIRNQEIFVLNVRNQERLHEKVTHFQLDGTKIVCYGTVIRIFQQILDDDLQHEKSKLQNMYTWRLTKLKKNGTIPQALQVKPYQRQATAQLVITSKTFIIVLTQIQQAIFFDRNTLTVKFTIILDIPFDAKIMKMCLSQDEKLLSILLFDQSIYIFNIYTQELFLHIKSTHFFKFTTASFLDNRNQYFLATGTQTGNICLFTYPITNQKQPKLLQLHTKAITCTILRKNLLISTSQDQVVGIWQLPFNILKHEIDFKNTMKPRDFLAESIGHFADNLSYFRSIQGRIYEINTKKGQFIKTANDFSEYAVCSIDSCTGNVIATQITQNISIWERGQNKNQWQKKKNYKIQFKNQIIGIGVIPSEKAIIFTGHQYAVWVFKNNSPPVIKNLIDFAKF